MHLTCLDHQKRVMYFDQGPMKEAKILHRSDGTRCGSRTIRIGSTVMNITIQTATFRTMMQLEHCRKVLHAIQDLTGII